MSAVPLDFKLSKYFFLSKNHGPISCLQTLHIKTKVTKSDGKFCVVVLFFASCLTQEVDGMIVRLFLDVKKSVSIVSCRRNKKAMTKHPLQELHSCYISSLKIFP